MFREEVSFPCVPCDPFSSINTRRNSTKFCFKIFNYVGNLCYSVLTLLLMMRPSIFHFKYLAGNLSRENKIVNNIIEIETILISNSDWDGCVILRVVGRGEEERKLQLRTERNERISTSSSSPINDLYIFRLFEFPFVLDIINLSNYVHNSLLFFTIFEKLSKNAGMPYVSTILFIDNYLFLSSRSRLSNSLTIRIIGCLSRVCISNNTYKEG